MYTILDEDSDSDTAKIRLDVDPYKGILYHYNTIQLGDEKEDGSVPLKYTYDIDFWPDSVDESHAKSAKLEKLMGDIVVAIIIEKENETRNNDTIISD
jgi:hypothetical protein